MVKPVASSTLNGFHQFPHNQPSLSMYASVYTGKINKLKMRTILDAWGSIVGIDLQYSLAILIRFFRKCVFFVERLELECGFFSPLSRNSLLLNLSGCVHSVTLIYHRSNRSADLLIALVFQASPFSNMI